jgi:hypothetical protein
MSSMSFSASSSCCHPSFVSVYMIHIYLLIILLLYNSGSLSNRRVLCIYVDAIGEGTGTGVIQQALPVVGGYQQASMAVQAQQPVVGYQTQQVGNVVQQVGTAAIVQQQPITAYQPAAAVIQAQQPIGYQTQQVGTVTQQVGTAYQTAAIQAQPVAAYQTRQAVVQQPVAAYQTKQAVQAVVQPVAAYQAQAVAVAAPVAAGMY